MYWFRTIWSGRFLAGLLLIGLYCQTAFAADDDSSGQSGLSINPDLFHHASDGIDANISALNPVRAPEPIFPNSVGSARLPAPRLAPSSSIRSQQYSRELMQKKKDWAFANPDEVYSGMTDEQAFGLEDTSVDAQLKQNMTPIERFSYEQQLNRKLRAENPNKKRILELNTDRENVEEGLTPDIWGNDSSASLNSRLLAPLTMRSGNSAGDLRVGKPNGNGAPKIDQRDLVQQSWEEEYKRMIGFTTADQTVNQRPETPQVNPWQQINDRPAPKSTESEFGYVLSGPAIKPTAITPMFGSASPMAGGFTAPTAPEAPGKPTATPSVTTAEATTEKPNLMFLKFEMPKRRFQ